MYFGGFGSKADIAQEFQIPEVMLNEVTIHVACYCIESWEGSAFVLFEFRGQLYEVNGSHCSCYGLEDQWNPEETSWLDMYHRCTKGRLGVYGDEAESFKDYLLELIQQRWSVQ